MFMHIDLKKLATSIIIPLTVGGISAFITSDAMKDYKDFNRPPLAPPSWLFPVVWTILYILMGVSFYLVRKTKTKRNKTNAYILFAVQLFLNFIWSPIFFIGKAYLTAFIVLVALLLSVIGMTVSFYRINKLSGYLQIPYIIWLLIAGYLNLGIYILN